MTDTPPDPAEPASSAEPGADAPADTPHLTLPAFTPVPRLQNRRDGWAPAVQEAFIEALADCGSVEAACRYVDKSPASAYRLRRHPEGAEFARAWQAAIDMAIQRIEDYATDRALNGVEIPVFAYGDKIATRRVHNETLVMFMLRNRRPERYCEGGAKGLSALDKRALDRLKKQWRAEWEREKWALEAEEEQETLESIDRFLGNMRSNHLANMSPAQRERQIAADAQARADKAAGWSPGTAYREHAEEAAALLPRFIAEVEADWPELAPWAWDEPDGDEAEADACPEPGRRETPALPPPVEEGKDGPEVPEGAEDPVAEG